MTRTWLDTPGRSVGRCWAMILRAASTSKRESTSTSHRGCRGRRSRRAPNATSLLFGNDSQSASCVVMMMRRRGRRACTASMRGRTGATQMTSSQPLSSSWWWSSSPEAVVWIGTTIAARRSEANSAIGAAGRFGSTSPTGVPGCRPRSASAAASRSTYSSRLEYEIVPSRTKSLRGQENHGPRLRGRG